MAKKAKANKPADMDQKSANPGDRMKHALSLEVLSRTADWPIVTYSETHAGGGVYDESKQRPAKAYIRTLRELVFSIPFGPASEAGAEERQNPAPGEAYLELLKRWWAEPEQSGKYPGSAKQAGEYLAWQRRQFKLLVTEYDQTTFSKLKDAVSGYPSEVKNESFEPNLKWMTAPEHLYLVVDPFKCLASFTGHPNLSDDKFGVTKGDIDHRIVQKILRLCSKRTAAVMHFWWPTISPAGKSGVAAIVADSNRQTRRLFRTWASKKKTGRCYCQFDDNHNHASALLGVGKGADIVRQIGGLAWEKSWLSPFLRLSGNTSE